MNTTIIENKPLCPPAQVILCKRIGSTNYIVSVQFSDSTKETMEDKILRLIKREAEKSA